MLVRRGGGGECAGSEVGDEQRLALGLVVVADDGGGDAAGGDEGVACSVQVAEGGYASDGLGVRARRRYAVIVVVVERRVTSVAEAPGVGAIDERSRRRVDTVGEDVVGIEELDDGVVVVVVVGVDGVVAVDAGVPVVVVVGVRLKRFLRIFLRTGTERRLSAF